MKCWIHSHTSMLINWMDLPYKTHLFVLVFVIVGLTPFLSTWYMRASIFGWKRTWENPRKKHWPMEANSKSFHIPMLAEVENQTHAERGELSVICQGELLRPFRHHVYWIKHLFQNYDWSYILLSPRKIHYKQLWTVFKLPVFTFSLWWDLVFMREVAYSMSISLWSALNLELFE